MYNESIKKRFIEQYTRKESTMTTCEVLFNHFEEYEIKWEADLCTQDTATLQSVIDKLSSLRMKSTYTRIIILKEYVKWCIKNSIPGACDGMLKITHVGLDKVKLNTVSSPAHLQYYLDKLLAPAEDKTTDCIYRCYLWLAFCGVNEEDIYKIKCSDVNLSDMTVRYGYDDILLYRESFAAFKICATSEQFAHGTPGVPGYRLVDRIAGDQLIRGVRSMIDSKGMQIQLARKSSEKFGKDGMRISFARARLSGIFYRMYERERMGVPVDFSDIADHDMEGRKYSASVGSSKNIKHKLIKGYEEDYARWKLAYSN